MYWPMVIHILCAQMTFSIFFDFIGFYENTDVPRFSLIYLGIWRYIELGVCSQARSHLFPKMWAFFRAFEACCGAFFFFCVFETSDSTCNFWENASVQYEELLLYWFTIRKLKESKAGGWTRHWPWNNNKWNCLSFVEYVSIKQWNIDKTICTELLEIGSQHHRWKLTRRPPQSPNLTFQGSLTSA